MLDSSQFIVRSLLEDGRISDQDATRAVEHAQAAQCDVPQALVQLQIITARDLAIARAKLFEHPFVDLTQFEIDIQNAKLLPQRVAERLCAFPLFMCDKVATVALEDPLNLQAIDQVTQALKREVDPVLCETDRLRALIARSYSLTRSTEGGTDEIAEDGARGDEPVVVACNQILFAAAEAGASDIHVNPDESRLHLRFRVDGALRAEQGPDIAMHSAIVQRLKVLARLDVTQTRRPQDGKFRFRHRDTDIDVRLSLLPTIHGENVVMRLLRPASRIGKIADLGMPEDMTANFEALIEKPHGIILVTGPTGSGKTTTLYTALQHINSPDVNIMTIEDPVEIRLPMIRQIQANAEIGLTFAAALRSILRQDPDVVLVGEIRDAETAKIAVQAALTGHLVFSTLHTNDAVGSIARLRDFGLPSFAINNALLGAIAQRLVRRTCEHCRQAYQPTAEELRPLGLKIVPGASFMQGKGCGKCMSTGYAGRQGVYEMVRVTPGLHQLIEKDADSGLLLAQARRDGMRTMLEDGYDKALRGITTIDELRKLTATVSGEETEQADTNAGTLARAA